jgi:hypothetical protein
MAKSKNESSKLKVEQVGNPQKPLKDQVSDVVTKIVDAKLIDEAISLGMPKENAEKFTDEDLLKSTIDTLKAISVASKNPVAVSDPVNPKEDREIEKHWNSKAERQKAYFDSLPQIRILVPCEGKEKPGVVEDRMIDGRMQTVPVSGAVWSKTVNGYRVVIPKGVYTNVSEAIAENIQDELHQVAESNAQFSIDRLDENGKPIRERLE